MRAGAARRRFLLYPPRRKAPKVPAEGWCPSGKARFDSRGKAAEALRQARWSPEERRQERRVYDCGRCGGWHLTSEE